VPARRKWLLLVALLLIIAGARSHSYNEPLERDIAIYSIIGQEMLKGRALYSDLWDLKPPLLYLVYSAAHAITPNPRAAIYLLTVSMSFLILLGIVRLVERFEPGWIWIWAAVTWTVISGVVVLQANQPNAEVFMNAAVVWFLVAALKQEGPSRLRTVASAAALAAASFIKPVVIALGLFLAIAQTATAGEALRPAVIRRWVFIAGFGLVAWIAMMLYFSFAGTFDEFYNAVFEFSSDYSGSWTANLWKSFTPDLVLPGITRFLLPLIALTIFGIVAGVLKPRTRRFSILLLAVCAATWAEVAMPGKFFPHYYQLWLPVAVIGGAWGLTLIRSSLHAKAIAAAIPVLLAALELPQYRLSAAEWSVAKYGDEFAVDQQFASELRQILQPGETFYHWGNQPSLYLDTGVAPPSGVFFALMLPSPVVGDRLAARLLEDLKTRPPDLYVESTGWPYCTPCLPLTYWRTANFRKLEDTPRHGRFQLYARVGSALALRHGIRE